MRINEKHALWIRAMHWLNVPLLALMCWSGLLIYWANDVYPGFFPEWFTNFFHIDHRLAEGLTIHFTVAWPFVINGLLFVLLTFSWHHWQELLPNKTSVKNLLPTVLHDLGFNKRAPAQGKFNAAQQFAYTGVIAMAILQVLTGLAIYKPLQLHNLTWILGGYETARFLHFAIMILLFLFFLLHIAQVIRAGWNNFRAMVAGYEVEDES
ncbi:MAG: cytochrome b/b6 domain-containing protein [Bdellovibrionota bacterium]